ncbi:hypothetical protein NUW58_g1339 [Xylaria curta]|uniref:Uncharacterized protein n=1 Tax=Xylaria curta TaxID=42375 RepID=A0ACC1PN74_9PEZI|nr:hypothetical protein NUW58_g1339 [Xylaria curta]
MRHHGVAVPRVLGTRDARRISIVGDGQLIFGADMDRDPDTILNSGKFNTHRQTEAIDSRRRMDTVCFLYSLDCPPFCKGNGSGIVMMTDLSGYQQLSSLVHTENPTYVGLDLTMPKPDSSSGGSRAHDDERECAIRSSVYLAVVVDDSSPGQLTWSETVASNQATRRTGWRLIMQRE